RTAPGTRSSCGSRRAEASCASPATSNERALTMRAPDGLARIAAVLLAAPLPVAARVTGTVEVQSQTVRTLGSIQGLDVPITTATLLQETVALHYAGLPFGPSAALITMGGGFTNINGSLGNGIDAHGTATSWDLSAAFLPRRAYPLRLFTRGSLVSGPPGIVASTGGSLSLAYGGAPNLGAHRAGAGLRLGGGAGPAPH